MKKDCLQLGMNCVMENEGDREVVLSIFKDDYLTALNGLLNEQIEVGVVCFTGNRPTSLPWRYNEDCELCKEFKSRLKLILKKLIDNGSIKFISGMAMGFDIIAAETVMDLKREGENIELECAVPCLNQTIAWDSKYKERYQYIIDNADKVTFTSNYAYFNGCFTIRNQYMVDNANIVLGCQLKQSSGTKSTLKYAKKQNKKIIVIN